MARLAALIPSPQVNLTRYHGVFAPNHRFRVKIVPGREETATDNRHLQSPRHTSNLPTMRPIAGLVSVR